MSVLYLIRHGKTIANEQHRYCGSTDLPLSPRGREELASMRYALSGVRFLTSGMLRAEQTLELLFGPVPHEIRPEFREIDFGEFEMHTYEELKDDPKYLAWITGDNERNVPPAGESGEAMTSRVLRGLNALLEEDRDTVLITHGGVIAAIMESLFPGEGKNRYQWQPEPGCGYCLEGKRWRLLPQLGENHKKVK